MNKAAKRTAIIIAALLIVFFVASLAIDVVMLGNTFKRTDSKSSGLYPSYEAYAEGHPRKSVEFEFQGKTLRGYVYEAQNPKGFIVFRHGIFSQHSDYMALITALVDKGWTVFAYDAIGCGESDGDDVKGMAQSPLDVAAAVNYVRESGLVGNLPIALWGHSWGGYGVAAALDLVPDVAACVTMSGYNKPSEILLDSAVKSMGPAAYTQKLTLWLANKLAFGADADRTAVAGINKTTAPVLVIHSTGDEVVGYDSTSIISQRDKITNPNVEYLTFDDPNRNGHNTYFSSAEASAYYQQKAQEYKDLESQYPEGVPVAEQEAFNATYDVCKACAPNPDLVQPIDDFLTKAVN